MHASMRRTGGPEAPDDEGDAAGRRTDRGGFNDAMRAVLVRARLARDEPAARDARKASRGRLGASVHARRVLMVSENSPVPSDRRVWNEARALRDAGWRVVVVCAQGRTREDVPFELCEGIEIHRYALRPSAGGLPGYAREYAQAMWRIRRLARRLARNEGFDVVHACNPPDFLLVAARGLRRNGTRLIFDHHDLVPELYRAKFGARGGPMLRVAMAMERIAFRMADVVVCTNGSYRTVALGRGGRRPEDVFVVRNGPDIDRFKPAAPDPSWKRGR